MKPHQNSLLADRHAIMDSDQFDAVIHVAGRYVHIYNYNNVNPPKDEIHIIVDTDAEAHVADCKAQRTN